ncbi:hemolysin III family protein [Actinomycetospora sp. CA-101289]|uniref:hemolysin III family protein n=1 Tax=Actinomycetospora sp. CA-101289 TaxID=3239893 RepID=UPI003D98E3D5
MVGGVAASSAGRIRVVRSGSRGGRSSGDHRRYLRVRWSGRRRHRGPRPVGRARPGPRARGVPGRAFRGPALVAASRRAGRPARAGSTRSRPCLRATDRARDLMGRLDQAMIFVLIAGTYTPLAVLGVPPAHGIPTLVAVWAAALAGVVLSLCWARAPRWPMVALYLALGWAGVLVLAATVGAAVCHQVAIWLVLHA